MVDRNGATGEGPGPVTRPDFEPTINEVEPPGFVIDGTDSFAVPGPGDGLPPADDGSPSARARVLLTAGSVIAGLVFVVAVGSGSDAGDAQVRTADERNLFAVGWWDGESDEPAPMAGPIEPNDADTLAMLETSDGVTTTTKPVHVTYSRTLPTYDFDDDEFATGTFDDDEFTTPRVTVPRRPPPPAPRVTAPPPRPRTTTPTRSGTTTTTTATTTPTEDTTTTVDTTTTTDSTTATTTLPAGPWVAAKDGLAEACSGLQLWPTGGALLATADNALFRLTDGRWAAVTNGGLTFDGPVQSLSASLDGDRVVVALAVGGSGPTLHRFDGIEWKPITLPIGTPSGVRLVNDKVAFAGTDRGLLRSDDGGATWNPDPIADESVSGHPWLGPDGSINWRLADGSGVLRGNRTGDSWETVTEQLPPQGSPVAALPDRRLLAVVGDVLTVRTDSATGTTWEPFAPAPNIKPLGVVYSALANAPFVFSAACEVERFVP